MFRIPNLSLPACPLWLTNGPPARKASDREEGDALGGAHSEDNGLSGACTQNDGRPEEREMLDIDTVPERRKKRRALSLEERPSATEEEILPQDVSESEQDGMEEHPLQASVTTLALWVLVPCTSEIVRESRWLYVVTVSGFLVQDKFELLKITDASHDFFLSRSGFLCSNTSFPD